MRPASRAFVLIAAVLVAPLALAQQFVDQTSTRFPVQSEYSSQVAIADVDGDGDLDVAFANGRGFSTPTLMEPVRLYLNNGLGFFTDESAARVGLSGYGRDVQFGDVDGDGDLDMVVANDFATLPRLLLNNGVGFFTNVTATHLPNLPLGSPHVALGDVDNDGDLDLWFANGGASRFGAGQAQLYLNDGTGHFTSATATHLPALLVSEPMDCLFGDIDGDFDLDMIEGHRAGNSRLYRNDGAGNFANHTVGNLPADSNTYSYDFGDLDGDGDLDLLGANSLPGSSREALFINNGLGTFSDQTAALLPGANNPSIDDNDSKFVDFDNDGDLDFVIASLSGSSPERFYRNNSPGFTLLTGMVAGPNDASLDIEFGDLDGDGDLDYVTAQGESGSFQNRIYINSGPADTIPPIFPALEQHPDTLDTAGPYVVRVVVRDSMTSDRNFFIEDAWMVYTVDGGAAQQVPLWYMGGDLYRATLPGQAAGSVVEYRATARDHNANQGTSAPLSFQVLLPPELFDRGDCNSDGAFDVADVIFALGYLFPPGAPPALPCGDACDANDDGALDISDAIAKLGALFPFGPPPGLPTPHGACGTDPTADALDCASAGACP